MIFRHEKIYGLRCPTLVSLLFESTDREGDVEEPKFLFRSTLALVLLFTTSAFSSSSLDSFFNLLLFTVAKAKFR